MNKYIIIESDNHTESIVCSGKACSSVRVDKDAITASAPVIKIK